MSAYRQVKVHCPGTAEGPDPPALSDKDQRCLRPPGGNHRPSEGLGWPLHPDGQKTASSRKGEYKNWAHSSPKDKWRNLLFRGSSASCRYFKKLTIVQWEEDETSVEVKLLF